MNLGYYISGVAGQMAQTKMDGISNNLANVNSAGYMEDRTSFSSSFAGKMGREGAPEKTSAAFLSSNTQYISTQAGTIHQTGHNLDFAVHGDGYFRVQMKDGSEALTRAGNFKLNSSGNLTTQSNLNILDNNNAPVQLPIGKITITGDGTISVNNQPITKLGVAMITDTRNMQKVAGNLISTDASNITAADTSVEVRQGELESSNVNSVLAMTQIVATMRNYQSMMKVVEQYNQLSGQLSDRVGMVSG
ncbi:MAG: flagellar hook basal-body protein [Mariprofundus sp.]|nr:flagellar hook basal-body protein [Mariprofundus sp.]